MIEVEDLAKMTLLQKQIDVLNGLAAAHWVALRDHFELIARHRHDGGKKAVETRRAREALSLRAVA